MRRILPLLLLVLPQLNAQNASCTIACPKNSTLNPTNCTCLVSPVAPRAPVIPSAPPTFPDNFIAIGAAYNPDVIGSPNINGIAAYGKQITSGTFSYTAWDAYFVKTGGKVQLVTAQRTGIAQYMRSISKLQLFAIVNVGIAETSTPTSGVTSGGSFAGGGIGLIPIKGGLALGGGGRIVKSNVTPTNKTTTIYEFVAAYSWK